MFGFGDSSATSWEDDRQLVELCRAGHLESERALCVRLECVPRILAVLNSRIGKPSSRADLEDLSQEVVIRVWEKLGDYEGRARFESWVYRFCFMVLMNHVRKEERWRKVRRVVSLEGYDIQREDVWSELSDYDTVLQALEDLGPPDAKVIRLRFFEDLSFLQISKALRVSKTSAQNYFQRGMAKLRHQMKVDKSLAADKQAMLRREDG